jgi:hypothetical protein
MAVSSNLDWVISALLSLEGGLLASGAAGRRRKAREQNERQNGTMVPYG